MHELFQFVALFGTPSEDRPFVFIDSSGFGFQLTSCSALALSRIVPVAIEFVDTPERDLCHQLRWFGQLIEQHAAEEGEQAARLFDWAAGECARRITEVRAAELVAATLPERRWARLAALFGALACDARGEHSRADLLSPRGATHGGAPAPVGVAPC